MEGKFLTNDPLGEVAKTIFLGNSEAAIHSTIRGLDEKLSIEDLILGGILKAWEDYGEWYDRDPNSALKRWHYIVATTYKVLKILEARIVPDPNPLFAVLVITMRGEGHVLIKDILTVLLKSKGLKVYTMRKGVAIEDVKEPLHDPFLKFVIISCTQEETREPILDLIRMIRAIRPDLKVAIGGPIAEGMGADIVISDPLKLFETLMGVYQKVITGCSPHI